MTKGSKKPEKSKNCCLSRFVGQVPSHQRQQKTQGIPKLLPFKICRTSALAPKAAKSPRNPKIAAFQDLSDKRPRTKGSKKPRKSQNCCLSRFAEQEPQDERQQKAREIQKSMPFKICRTSAFAPKAAKSPINSKIDAFQDLSDKCPRTKGSKKPEKSKNCCLLRFVGQAPSHKRQLLSHEIPKLLPL